MNGISLATVSSLFDLCPTDGCDVRSRANGAANPIGGEMGQRYPIQFHAMNPGLLF